MSERPVVLLDQLAELFRHLVGAGEHDRAGVRVELPTQAELEALQAVGHERLQPRQLLDVLVDAVVLQLTQGTDDLVQLAWIDVLAAKHAAQILRFVGVLPRLVAKLTDILRRQTNRTAIPPAAPRRTTSPGAATVEAAAGSEPAAVTSIAALSAAALTGLLPFALALTFALTLALALLPFLALPFLPLLAARLLVVALLIPLLTAVLLRTLARPLLQRFLALFKETMQADPDNPRLAWLDGGGSFYMAQFAPAEERAKQQAAGMATYKRGLEIIRKQRRPASALEPSWGEPELLMSLAWTSLNQDRPDVAAAKKYATEALALVPHWHYMKNILMAQILNAK